MISTYNTTIQSMPTYSKKVTDMILYAVAREMAKKLISEDSNKNQGASELTSSRKKEQTTKRKKMLVA